MEPKSPEAPILFEKKLLGKKLFFLGWNIPPEVCAHTWPRVHKINKNLLLICSEEFAAMLQKFFPDKQAIWYYFQHGREQIMAEPSFLGELSLWCLQVICLLDVFTPDSTLDKFQTLWVLSQKSHSSASCCSLSRVRVCSCRKCSSTAGWERASSWLFGFFSILLCLLTVALRSSHLQ